jgi:hypothetical protein
MNDSRLQILQMIDDGKISAAEGLRLLNALSGNADGAETGGPEAADPTTTTVPPSATPQGFGYWKRWWLIPFGVGTAIAVAGSALMYWAFSSADFRLTVWFFLAACPFAFGVTLLALAAASRNAKWLHIRVNTGQAEWPRRIALSFPLPIGPTAWFLRVFGPRIPSLKNTGVDELILALGETTTPDNPFYVEVDEGPGGEKVQVYIG